MGGPDDVRDVRGRRTVRVTAHGGGHALLGSTDGEEWHPVILWRKSALSGAQGNCVELARPTADGVLVRNSRHPDGAVLCFSGAAMAGFVQGIKAGEFDDLLGSDGAA